MLIVVCLIDALKANRMHLLKDFLNIPYSISGSIVPPFSFEPDASFLCGRYPEETDSGTHFWYNPKSNFFDNTGWAIRSIGRLPYPFSFISRKIVQKKAEQKAKLEGVRRPIHTARIPLSFLPYFEPVEKNLPIDSDFNHFPTIFNLLNEQKKKWIYLGLPGHSTKSKEVYRNFQSVDLEDLSLVFIFIGDLDNLGHKYGPESEEYKKGVHQIAELLKKMINRVKKEVEDFNLLIFGDHGMVEVTQVVDINRLLDGLPCRVPEDYIYFLDSTLVRFWFFNDKTACIVKEAMDKLEQGRFISEKDKALYRIRYSHNRFGDAIWWADGGTLISPNFWQDHKLVKGMHGYRQEVTDNHAGFMLFSSDVERNIILKESLEMVDIFATMVDLLGLKRPEGTKGMSIYQKIRNS